MAVLIERDSAWRRRWIKVPMQGCVSILDCILPKTRLSTPLGGQLTRDLQHCHEPRTPRRQSLSV